MSKFDAMQAVEAMEYDFTAYGGGRGTIPEPSNGQIDRFFKSLSSIYDKFKGLLPEGSTLDSTDPAAIEKAMETLEGLDSEVMNRYMAEAIAEVTSGSPNADEIMALPYRVQQAFMGWLVGELRPEGGTPATKR